MEYDFLSFIDSEAIREHIRSTGYVFTPAEQAVLISCSCNRTVKEKPEALEYILRTYSEKELGSDKVGMFGFGDRSSMPFSKRLRAYITGIKSSLVLKQTDVRYGYVFITSECEKAVIIRMTKQGVLQAMRMHTAICGNAKMKARRTTANMNTG